MGSAGKLDKLQEAAQAVSAAAPSGGAVLIVEDDPDMQWRLARMLTVQGHRVVGTSTADGALALMSQWPVDLVLAAEHLPGATGLELAEQIRERHSEIPVVLMTTDDDEGFRAAALIAGAVACLIKPFRVEALVDLVDSFVSPLAEPAE